MKVQAINSSHQKTVNRFIKAAAQYDARIDYLHAKDIDDSEDALAWKFHTNASHYLAMLPKREQLNISKQGFDIAGY